jgi:hypothetical protein
MRAGRPINGLHRFHACRSNLRIRLIPLPHNWVLLPQAQVNSLLLNQGGTQAVLRLKQITGEQRSVYVSWNGLYCREAGCIEVPSALGMAFGLKDGDLVRPEVASGLPTASLVHVTSASVDDWEVIESNAEHLTTALLQQVKVVRQGDTVPIWIRGQSSVNVKISNAQPADVVVLKNDSIVSVEPPPKDMVAESAANDREPPAKQRSSLLNGLAEYMPNFSAASTPVSITGPMRLRIRVRFRSQPLLLGQPLQHQPRNCGDLVCRHGQAGRCS